MVLVAAAFSLRFVRFGGIGKMVASGVVAGFALYVVTKLVANMGGAGLLSAPVAGMGAGAGRQFVGCACVAASGGWLMGQRNSPALRRADTVRVRAVARGFALAGATALAFSALLQPLRAQTASPERMAVEAQELIQDNTKNTVTAHGNVQVYYKGRTLEADQVIYDRNTSRVYAEGHAKLTEKDGQVSYAERFDLTDDLRQGFIDSLQSQTTDKTYLSSPRAEYAGDARVYERPTYTACAPCEDPDRSPLWRVRARKIIHRTDEKNLYFEHADLELYGLPIAYLPFLSIPDPTVKRRSGLLSPHATYKSQLGYGLWHPDLLGVGAKHRPDVHANILHATGSAR